MKSERTRACEIPKTVKETVWERDGGQCVWCKNPDAYPNAHFIPRSRGGLGKEQNILTLCTYCHREYDQGVLRTHMGRYFERYLSRCYTGWTEADLIFRK